MNHQARHTPGHSLHGCYLECAAFLRSCDPAVGRSGRLFLAPLRSADTVRIALDRLGPGRGARRILRRAERSGQSVSGSPMVGDSGFHRGPLDVRRSRSVPSTNPHCGEVVASARSTTCVSCRQRKGPGRGLGHCPPLHLQHRLFGGEPCAPVMSLRGRSTFPRHQRSS